MNILGLNYIYHDSTACVIKDGELVVALEEERLSREKHTSSFPKQAIKRCLEISEIEAKDIDHIAISFQPSLNTGRKLMSLAMGEIFYPWVKNRHFKAWLNETYANGTKPEIHFVPHHFSHAVGSFFVSPYETAALLSVDGSGEWATTLKGVGHGNTFQVLSQDYFPYSLGYVYEAATELSRFRTHYDEGKTMGLAPLGNPDAF